MSITRITLGLSLLVSPLFAQDPVTSGSEDALKRVSSSANTRLEQSIAELNALRVRIAAEKLPLAQEITALEGQLTELRREYERAARTVDESKLEASNLKAATKARQDELTYVSNLLDEYARTFEAKVHVSELQYCGAPLESARQAAENKTLSASDRFARQIAFVEFSAQRLLDAIGGMLFPGKGVDPQGAVLEGRYALLGPVALFAANVGDLAGVVVPQSGSTNSLIRPLEGPLQAGLAALVRSGEGLVPLDPSRGGALKALVQRTNIVHIFEKGGPIMWPLLLASILALGTVIERLMFLATEKRHRDRGALEGFFAMVKRGELEGAVRSFEHSRFYVVRALAYALGHRESSLGNALDYAKAQEMKRFSRGIPILDTVITLAPLLGLLGTVTGMMGSFSIIGGDLNSPGAITGGIAEALIATAFGLGIAILSLLPFNFLNARLDEAQHELDSAASQLELVLQSSTRTDTVVAQPSSVLAPNTSSTQPVREYVNA